MDYPNKSFTNAGADLMAADDAEGKATIIDTMIVSQSLPDDSGEPLAEITLNDFDNPMQFQIDNYKHQDNTFQVEAVLNNNGLQDDYPINMVGLLAHQKGANNGQSTLLAVATADDPFILPKQTNTPFNFRIGIGLTYKNADNIQAKLSDAGTVSVKGLIEFKIDIKQIVNKAINAAINQGAASFAINHQEIAQLASNQNGFVSSADSAMASDSKNNQSAINDNSRVGRKVLEATINQAGTSFAENHRAISQLSDNQQLFATSASSMISSATSANNNANQTNKKAAVAVLNQEAAENAAISPKRAKVAVAALNQDIANNYLLKSKILG